MAEVEAMAAQLVRVPDTIASQRAVTRTLVLGYSQGGHIAWRLVATGRFEVVLPVSGALAPGYQPPPPTGIVTNRALHGEDITPLLTATLSPQPVRTTGVTAPLWGR